jgi:hypothetical protein
MRLFSIRHALSVFVLVTGLALLSTTAFAGPNGPTKPSGVTPLGAIIGTLTVTGVQTIAPSDECSSVSVTVTGAVQGTVDDHGGLDDITFDLWDDGSLKASQTVSVPVGATRNIAVTLSFLGRYLTGAAGVGVYAGELGWSADPFYPTDVTGNCPMKCWISPESAKVGDYISIQVEIPAPAAPTVVRAYNGDVPIASMSDPDGDGIYSGTWRVPASPSLGWKTQFSVMAKEGSIVRWCPGFKLIPSVIE